ncbi:phosphate acyltransferase PlsX [Suttonella sp. R2A3]|uniref:phosphate acyltransferase PlsX n=1 Tax=Suttonella sp. R2A3 TaxID=2908648 RepID=UPI001F40DB07|nr:phosphate acyltransferase PlsX [Suttonella sp. R2A3]UJF24089.1 phosphate acyltransferase PlsX [Suttonella sp. R2A3]
MTKHNMPTIAIDAMGGDVGLDVTLVAAAHAQKQHQDLQLILVGDEAIIHAHKAFASLDKSRMRVHHASQIVAMDESPANVLRNKNDSSMWQAISLVREGEADACVSAGNTGALMASARYILKMLPGISRPAICATLPTAHGHVHWLDLGANVDARPEQLEQFAVMGSELAKAVDDNPSPRVGLLNIGEEAIKGNDTVKETGKRLEQGELNYIGFVEGNDIFLKEGIDVVVCDGFVGNVALKTIEGIAKFLQIKTKAAFKRNPFTLFAGLVALPVFKSLRKTVDPRTYNGASLLGLQGIVIKSHGNADAYAFANAINIARLEIENGVIGRIGQHLQQLADAHSTTEEEPTP